MIYLEECDNFKKIYLEKAQKTINKELSQRQKEELLITINTFLPKKDSGDGYIESINELITMDFQKIKKAIDYIDRNESDYNAQCFSLSNRTEVMKPIFEQYKNLYTKLMKKQFKGKKLPVLLVEALGICVCPYCNREYINSRGLKVAGAEMDHFFAKAKYPFLAISLNNLVPSCRNCNKVKSDKRIGLSPFNLELKISLDEQIFQFNEIGFEKFEVVLTNCISVQNNFSQLKIKEAYAIHSNEIQNLHKLVQIYNTSQRQEINELISRATNEIGSSSTLNFKQLLFGMNYRNPDLKNEPLSKFKYDILKQLKIID